MQPSTRGRDAAKELTLGEHFTSIHDRFLRDHIYRESQLAIGWTEQKFKEMDELAKQDHTYRLSAEEFKRYQGQRYLTLIKSGNNAPTLHFYISGLCLVTHGDTASTASLCLVLDLASTPLEALGANDKRELAGPDTRKSADDAENPELTDLLRQQDHGHTCNSSLVGSRTRGKLGRFCSTVFESLDASQVRKLHLVFLQWASDLLAVFVVHMLATNFSTTSTSFLQGDNLSTTALVTTRGFGCRTTRTPQSSHPPTFSSRGFFSSSCPQSWNTSFRSRVLAPCSAPARLQNVCVNYLATSQASMANSLMPITTVVQYLELPGQLNHIQPFSLCEVDVNWQYGTPSTTQKLPTVFIVVPSRNETLTLPVCRCKSNAPRHTSILTSHRLGSEAAVHFTNLAQLRPRPWQTPPLQASPRVCPK